MRQEPIILRRLKTRDGIVSPIEEIREFRYDEIRAFSRPQFSAMVAEGDVALGPFPAEPNRRHYRVRKQVPAILLEMEEE